MRIPFTFGLRRILSSAAAFVLAKTGRIGDETRFYVTDIKKASYPKESLYTAENFNSILSNSKIPKPLADAVFNQNRDTMVYHCFSTRLVRPSMAESAWAMSRVRHKVSYNSLRHDIEYDLSQPERVLDHHAFEANFIRIDGEDIVEWLRDTTRGTTHIMLISDMTNGHETNINVSIEFTDSKDAVAFKMVFG